MNWRGWRNFEAIFAQRAWARYAAAAGFVLATLVVRVALDPLFGPGVFYHLYYPAIILATYLFGARAGVLAMILSASCAFFLFALRRDSDVPAYLPLLAFIGANSVIIYVLSHIRRRLNTLSQEYDRVEALTQKQADLFREHAERVSDHLQLVSALLQVQARGETRDQHARVLMNAASRTMLISRMHRAFAHDEGEEIDFNNFAVRLANAALHSRERPPLTVLIEGEGLTLPLEQASALGIALLECINARAARKTPGVLRVALRRSEDEGLMRVAEEGAPAEAGWFGDAVVLSAIAEQLGGSLVVSSAGAASVLEMSFSTKPRPLPDWAPLAALN